MLCNSRFLKRLSHGLQFDMNYTWSKMLDEQDSSGWGSRDGGQNYQVGVQSETELRALEFRHTPDVQGRPGL